MSDTLATLSAALEGRYRLERQVGEGGMATVYLADDLRHDRKVALKVLRPEVAASIGADRFLREIATTASLRHPNILPLYDSDSEQGALFYVMPFVEGGSLHDRLEREGPLPVDEVVRLLGEITDALAYAHERGVIHRDIKPENILLENGHAVLTDFGIARAVSESAGQRLTRTGTTLGTPLYMSPEQANAERVDARSDLYSLACVAYEMLAGTPPFRGPSALVVLARHALDPVPPLRTARPGVPAALAVAIERALAKTPADRFESIRAWRDALSSPAPLPPEPSTLDIPLQDRPSVAIVPFKNLGSDPDHAYLADGLRYGIQATLTQLSGMFLVNAGMYRDGDVDVMSVGRELDARYVMEGAVLQQGPRIRVTVQLTDVHARRAIWAERYDRLLDDVFELQDEITRDVIWSVGLKLLVRDEYRVWFSDFRGEAREHFYRGLNHFYTFTPEDNAAARDSFEALCRVQPESVMGPSYVAVTHWLDMTTGWSDDPERSKELAVEWAKKAMEYEGNNGLGHVVLGHHRLLEGEHDEALALCSEGARLRASCPFAHGILGVVLNYCGKPREAIREVRQSIQLDRMYPPWILGALATAYRDAGEIDVSISAARETLRMAPRDRDATLVLCSDYELAGSHDEASDLAHEVAREDPDFRVSDFAARQPYRDPAPLEHVVQALRDAGLPA